MHNEDYWQVLLDILINIGRQNEKSKIELCENSIGPKLPEQHLPFSLWTYDQRWKRIWRINVSSVYDHLFRSRIDNEYRTLRSGLRIIVDELTEDEKFEKLTENIWAYDEVFPVDEPPNYSLNHKRGWLYEDFEGLVEAIEITLLGNLFITQDMARQILEMQKKFDVKQAAEDERLSQEIEEWKKQNKV
jgi:hypothetical protein